MWRNVISLRIEGTPLIFHARSHPISAMLSCLQLSPCTASALVLSACCPTACRRRRLHRSWPFRTKKILGVHWHTCSLSICIIHLPGWGREGKGLACKVVIFICIKYFMCSERITLGTHSHRMLCQLGIRKNPRRMVPQGGSWEESWSYTAQACRALFLYYPMDKNKKKAYFTGELRVDGWALSQQPSWQQPWLGPYSLSRALGPSLAKPPDPPEKLGHAHTAC